MFNQMQKSPINQEYKKFFLKQIMELYHRNALDDMDHSMVDDFVSMAACLATEGVVIEQLKELDAKLLDALMAKGLMGNDETIIKKIGKSYTSNHKVLSEVIHQWAQENGLNQGGWVMCLEKDEGSFNAPTRKPILLPAQIPTIYGSLIDSDLFLSILIGQGYLIFKDEGAPSESHGEFSHVWGVYVVVEANKKYKFLKNDIVDVLKNLGKAPYIGYQNPSVVQQFKEVAMWEIVFDNIWKPGMLNHPGTLQKLIVESKSQLPTLSQIVQGRKDKREKNSETHPRAEKKRKGIIINNCVSFNTSAKRKLKFDDIESECYDAPKHSSLTLPEIPKDVPLLDQALSIFNPENWPSPHNKNDMSHANELYHFLKNRKEGFFESGKIDHRELTLYLSRIRSTLSHSDEYLKVLIDSYQSYLLKTDQQTIIEAQSKLPTIKP